MHTYRHVDILNRNGLDAYVLHPGNEFRVSWFENGTRVISEEKFRRYFNPAKDFLVVPEDLGPSINSFPGKKIIFNKNVFWGFQALGKLRDLVDPYLNREVVGAFAVSDHNFQTLKFAYPSLRLDRMFVEISPAVFRFVSWDKKKLKIAVMLKNSPSVLAVLRMLQARSVQQLNRSADCAWVFLEDLTEDQVAKELGESIALLFLSVDEGLGRLPLEAMSCGCLVAGFDAGPIRETVPIAERFEVSNIIGVVSFLEKLIDEFLNASRGYDELIEQGVVCAARYSVERQERQVLKVWASYLAGNS